MITEPCQTVGRRGIVRGRRVAGEEAHGRIGVAVDDGGRECADAGSVAEALAFGEFEPDAIQRGAGVGPGEANERAEHIAGGDTF